MKKIIPLLVLCSLGLISPSVSSSKEVINLEAYAPNTTYLVLTENGLYNGEKGDNDSTLFLENFVTFQGAVGDPLPGSDVVTNSVSGVTFAGWVRYNSNGVPEGVTEISDVNELIVYASWTHDGSNLPTGGGGGSGDTPSGETMRVYFRSPTTWTNANIYYWQTGGDGPNSWPGVAMNKDSDTGLWYYDYDTVKYDNVIFNNGSEQTADLKSPTSEDADCYVWNSGWHNDDTNELPIDPVLAGALYLKPNSNWLIDNARFAAYFFGNSSTTWLSMVDSNSDGVYEVEVPSGYSKVIFCRMNPANTVNDWANKWNQTSDLNIPTDGTNLYTINNGSWDTGTWSTFNG